MAVQTPARITAAEYYQLPEYAQHDLIQLIDGEVVIGVAPIPKHQDVVGDSFLLLKLFSKQHGGKAYVAPIEVYLDALNIYEPDLVYLAPNSRCVIEEKRLVGAPELVVEVLSAGTAKQDREKKFRAYQRHGVREYWIADPANIFFEVWVLRDDAFEKLGLFEPGDTFTSTVLGGESISVSALFGG